MRLIEIGTEVLIRAEVVQVGRTMAFLRGTMSSLDEKLVYCTAEHHKVYVPMKKQFKDVKVEWDDLWEGEGVGAREKEHEKSKL